LAAGGWRTGPKGAACWEEVEVVARLPQKEEVVVGKKTTEAGQGSNPRKKKLTGRAVPHNMR
jgi:hypothetical protein